MIVGPGLVRYFAARQISRLLSILGAILAPTTGAAPPALRQALVQFPEHCKIPVRRVCGLRRAPHLL